MTDAIAAGPLATGEPLQPQDLLITLLGTYVRPFGSTVWSGGLVVLLGEFGFSHGAARVALTRLVRRGLVERVRSGRLVHYRITPRCDRLLLEGDGRIFSLGDPHDDGTTWTLVWHQIPEDRRLERGRLARRLRFLGFGSVQDSLWVSPHDHVQEVSELLGELEVSEFATLFRAPVADASGLGAFVSTAWNLSGLIERYQGFADEFEAYLEEEGMRRLPDADAFAVRTRCVHLFREFPVLDPELPTELAPPVARPRMRAVQVFHRLYESLAEPAQRHFEAVTSAPGAGLAGSAPRPIVVE